MRAQGRFDDLDGAELKAWVRQKSVLAARRQHDEDERAASAAGGWGLRLLVSRFNELRHRTRLYAQIAPQSAPRSWTRSVCPPVDKYCHMTGSGGAGRFFIYILDNDRSIVK